MSSCKEPEKTDFWQQNTLYYNKNQPFRYIWCSRRGVFHLSNNFYTDNIAYWIGLNYTLAKVSPAKVTLAKLSLRPKCLWPKGHSGQSVIQPNYQMELLKAFDSNLHLLGSRCCLPTKNFAHCDVEWPTKHRKIQTDA